MKKVLQGKLKELNMSEEELSSKLEEAAKHNFKIRLLLKQVGAVDKWSDNLIKQINLDLFAKNNKKITEYVLLEKSWSRGEYRVLFIEEGSEFSDPNLHLDDGDKYKLVEVVDINEQKRKVVYEHRFTTYEIAVMKLKEGKELSESEIEAIFWVSPEVFEQSGESRRWSKSVTTVVDIDGQMYAIDWEKGLTENQEDSFMAQPYKVRLEEEEVIITETVIIKEE